LPYLPVRSHGVYTERHKLGVDAREKEENALIAGAGGGICHPSITFPPAMAPGGVCCL